MKLSLAQFPAQLARGLPSVWLIAGEEPLLVQEALDALRVRARREGYEEREVLDVDKSFDWSLAYASCHAMSLFASRRIVELRMPGAAPGAEGGAMLCRLAEQPSPDTLLILSCEALDTRTRASAWYQAFERAGAALYIWPIETAAFAGWIEQRMTAVGLRVAPEALALLRERTEGNALAAAQDVAKLALLFPGERIGVEQVREAVADSARFDAFDLAERMLEGDAPGSLRSLERLREAGADPNELVSALGWTLRQWTQAQAAYGQSGDAERACQAAQVPRPRQPAMRRALARARLPLLYGCLRRLAAVDRLAKSTGGKERAWEELLTLVTAAAGVAWPRSRTTT